MAFEGVRPVLHLPFADDPDESIRHDELRSLALRMIELRSDGLVALGLGSEAWAVREGERDEVIATVAAAIAGRVPLVVGLDGATSIAVDRARRAVAGGATGLMVLPPSSARTTDQLVTHFGRVAEAAGVPILVQDSPQVTGVQMTVDALVAIARGHPLCRAVKSEIPGGGAKTSAVLQAGLEVVAGWGGTAYPEQILRGASGCMPGCDLGPAIGAIDRLARAGRDAEAAELYRAVLPLLSYEAQSLDLLLLGAKRLLRRQGIFSSDALRAPARTLDPVEAATLDGFFEALEQEGIAGFGSRGGQG